MKLQNRIFCTSLEYAKTAFAQIYLLDCLVEQKENQKPERVSGKCRI